MHFSIWNLVAFKFCKKNFQFVEINLKFKFMVSSYAMFNVPFTSWWPAIPAGRTVGGFLFLMNVSLDLLPKVVVVDSMQIKKVTIQTFGFWAPLVNLIEQAFCLSFIQIVQWSQNLLHKCLPMWQMMMICMFFDHGLIPYLHTTHYCLQVQLQLPCHINVYKCGRWWWSICFSIMVLFHVYTQQLHTTHCCLWVQLQLLCCNNVY